MIVSPSIGFRFSLWYHQKYMMLIPSNFLCDINSVWCYKSYNICKSSTAVGSLDGAVGYATFGIWFEAVIIAIAAALPATNTSTCSYELWVLILGFFHSFFSIILLVVLLIKLLHSCRIFRYPSFFYKIKPNNILSKICCLHTLFHFSC